MSAFTVSAAAPTVQVRASVGPARRGASVRVSQVSRDADPIHSSHRDVTYDTMERYTGISAPYTKPCIESYPRQSTRKTG